MTSLYFKEKKGRGFLAQLLIIILLTSIALSGIIGLLYYLTINFGTKDVSTLSDISGTFGHAYGFKQTKQTKQTSDTGQTSTLITSTLDSHGIDSTTAAVTFLGDTLNKVSQSTTIDLDLTINGDKTTYLPSMHIQYFTQENGPFDNGTFSRIVNLVKALPDTKFDHYDIVYRPTESGLYLTVNGGVSDRTIVTNETAEMITFQKDFILFTTKIFPFKYGDVFDITFENSKTSPDSNIPGLHWRTTIDSDYTLTWATSLDPYLATFIINFAASEKSFYEAMGIQEVYYIQSTDPTKKQLILIIKDQTPEKLAAVKTELLNPKYQLGKLIAPNVFDVIVRYNINDVNKLTIPSNY